MDFLLQCELLGWVVAGMGTIISALCATIVYLIKWIRRKDKIIINHIDKVRQVYEQVNTINDELSRKWF